MTAGQSQHTIQSSRRLDIEIDLIAPRLIRRSTVIAAVPSFAAALTRINTVFAV